METSNIPSGGKQLEDEDAQIDRAPNAETPATVLEPDGEPEGPEMTEAERAPGRRWTTLIPTILFGVLMLVLGGVGGFVGRPYILPPTPTQTTAQQQQSQMKALVDMLVSKTRHFIGDANAPVTLLEIGDFQ